MPIDPKLSQQEIAEIVGPMHDELVRVARRILRRDDLAEDAAQEAIIAFWQAGHLPPNPCGWLVRAVVHRALHMHRTLCRRRHHEQQACCQRVETTDRHVASQAIENREFLEWLDEALGRLPETYRHVFILREVEHLDYDGIAMLLRIPVGTVRSRLSRARLALQDAYIRRDRSEARDVRRPS